MNAQAVDLAVAAALALELRRARGVGLRPQELLLSRPAEGLPDLAVRAAAGHRRTGGRSTPARGRARSRLTRIHLEEDAGKSLHEGFADSDRRTYVDFNRAGVPLIEIVSEPDLRTADRGGAPTSRRCGACWSGSASTTATWKRAACAATPTSRCGRPARPALGTKAEVKNVNSFRYLQKAIDYEIARQIDVVDRGGRVVQETRLFDAALGKTFSMRSKEEAHDYRYFPEPDLPPLRGHARAARQRRGGRAARAARGAPRPLRRRVQAAGLRRGGADREPAAGRLLRGGRAAAAGNAKAASNWVMGEVLRHAQGARRRHRAGRRERRGAGRAHPPGRRRHHQQHRGQGACSSRWTAPAAPPPTSSPSRGWPRSPTTACCRASSRGVLDAHADAVQQYRNGKKAAFGFLVGEAMKASSGQGRSAAPQPAAARGARRLMPAARAGSRRRAATMCRRR